jgi:predicted nucleic acid-binding protein
VSRIALLDINVLVALFDADHVHHDFAHDWFTDHHERGWATCPITENGFIRVVSNPKYQPDAVRTGDGRGSVAHVLRQQASPFLAGADLIEG